MKAAAAILVGLATAALSERVSYTSLSQEDQVSVERQLTQWKAQFGAIAQAEGFVPPASHESVQVNGHTLDELDRFQHTLLQVQDAAKRNPLARFTPFHKFALVNDDEFAALLGRFGNVRKNLRQPSFSTEVAQPEELLAEVNWTSSVCMPPVRDQGNCGSCWAFSTVGTAEIAHCLATGERVDLSEQQVVSCDTTNKGCKGGQPVKALEWIRKGVCTEAAWPYTSGVLGQNEVCNIKCSKKVLSLGETVYVTGEAALVQALHQQPVTVVVEAGNAVWKNYHSGVVTECPGSSSDHAVIAVGYSTSDDFIKIRNSWGPEWGESGYIRLKRGGLKAGTCNVGEYATYPNLLNSAPQPTAAPTPTLTQLTSSPSTTPTPTTTPLSPPATPQPTTTTTLSPTTTTATSPTTTTPLPTPTTAAPVTIHPVSTCGTCKTCYFVDVKWCVGSTFTKPECLASSGGIWCGQ